MKNNARSFGLYILAALLMGRLAAGEALEIGTPDPRTIDYPDGTPHSAEEIELGRQLFFDHRLSGNQTMSCASCHRPQAGMGDGVAKGVGSTGAPLGRNTPHIYNLAWNRVFFWDGRASSLEEQALGPIASPAEMNLPLDQAAARLQTVPGYRQSFARQYGTERITPELIGKAIAAFERTLISRDSPFDRHMRGVPGAMSEEAVRGMALFRGKANCMACHGGVNFTDESFHNLGMLDSDPGRGALDSSPVLRAAFKTPGLRNVALTAPYMHDGSLPTLEAVVRFYVRGGDRPGSDPLIKPLDIDEGGIRDLVRFMEALTDPVEITPPVLP
jgi:cytochrome c peroxidase